MRMLLSMTFTAVVLSVMTAVSAAPAAGAARPNIVIIFSDDAGYADFSMQGSKNFATPHIDSIAANGLRFTSGYVSAPVCSPSRAGLLTGRYQQRFGHEMNILAENMSLGLPVTEKTMADAMKGAGYRTIAIGKWHLGFAPQFHPLSRGFDDYYGFLGGARNYFPKGGGGGKQMLHNRQPVGDKFNYTTDAFAQQAARYIQENRNRPFFMYLAFNAVHGPFEALGSDLKQVRGLSDARKKVCAMTIALDRGVGVVLNELKKQGLSDNTIVFFLNDNGGPNTKKAYSNMPLHGFKASTWDGGIRVPFAVQWPAKLPRGKVYHSPVISLDIMPTIMAAAGITKPPGKPLDGVNLLPYLTGENKQAPHEGLYWRFGRQWAVRMGDWKLTGTGGDVQLFNLARDVGESQDLSSQPSAKRKELESAYAKWNAQNIPAKWQDGKHAFGIPEGVTPEMLAAFRTEIDP